MERLNNRFKRGITPAFGTDGSSGFDGFLPYMGASFLVSPKSMFNGHISGLYRDPDRTKLELRQRTLFKLFSKGT